MNFPGRSKVPSLSELPKRPKALQDAISSKPMQCLGEGRSLDLFTRMICVVYRLQIDRFSVAVFSSRRETFPAGLLYLRVHGT